ncbi:MAG: hypothetical protein ACOVQG_03645 [Crocinitomicaceae bacterium]|jgi:hypothetical protein
MNEIYVKSGKIGSIWLLGPISGIVLIPILSYLYGLSLSYFSLSLIGAAIKIFIFCVFAFFLAFVQMGTAQLSKCRNNRVKLLFYIVSTILAFYLSWVFCIFYKLFDSFDINAILELILNSNELIASFKSMFISSPGWNTFYWISELIGFVLVPFLCHLGLQEYVFCEDCNKWTTEKDFKLHLVYENLEQLQEIAERNVNKLLDLPIAENLDQNHILVNFHACESCMNSNTLNFDLVKCTESNGKVSKVKDDYSPVICISSSQLEAFKNKSQLAPKEFGQEKTPDVEIEYVEPVKTTFIESIFFSFKWKLTMGITSLLLIPTYVIEPFLGYNSTVETCESKEQVIQNTTRDNKTYVEYFFNIELAREKKESGNRQLSVPQVVGERINKGDKITIFYTKWRKENVEIKLQDGLIYPVREPYGMFIAMPIIHVICCFIFFGGFNNPPGQNDKNQKTKRIQLFIFNFLFSVIVIFSFYLSSKMFF